MSLGVKQGSERQRVQWRGVRVGFFLLVPFPCSNVTIPRFSCIQVVLSVYLSDLEWKKDKLSKLLIGCHRKRARRPSLLSLDLPLGGNYPP
jgi:hypothetical protein